MAGKCQGYCLWGDREFLVNGQIHKCESVNDEQCVCVPFTIDKFPWSDIPGKLEEVRRLW
jgi:hypothetical protein